MLYTTFGFFYFVYLIAIVVAMWKIYEKAGQPGWAAIIPFYNWYVLLKIVGKPGWWLIMFFVPFVNIIFFVWTLNMLSKSFGKEEGMTVLFFIFGIGYFLLGFGDAVYQGPYGDPAAYQAHQGRDKFDFESPSV